MKVWALTIICLLLFLKSSLPAETHRIEMIDMKFKPEYLTIKKGDTIIWENRDESSHAITFFDEELHNLLTTKRFKKVRHGKTATLKFDKSGEFEYSCIPHTGFKMFGTITVVEESAKLSQ